MYKSTPKTHNSSKTSVQKHTRDSLFDLVLDIGQGSHATLRIPSLNSDPVLLAKRFCFENNLSHHLITTISRRIKQYLTECMSRQNQEPSSNHHQDSSYSNISLNNNNPHYNKNTASKLNSQQKTAKHSLLDDSMMQYNTTTLGTEYSVNPTLNPGVMIYQRNTRLSQQHRRNIEKRIEDLKLIAESELTFKPKINDISRLIAERTRGSNSHLYSTSKRKASQEPESHAKTREQKELQECTFHPDISKSAKTKPKSINNTLQDISEVPNGRRSSKSVDRFDSLYRDWSRRKSRRQQMNASLLNDITPFKPKVNKLSQMIINGVSFEERQRKYSCQKMLKDEHNRRQRFASRMVETETGEPLYRPKTGRPPASSKNRNNEKLPVGEYLYNCRNQKQEEAERLRKQQSELVKPMKISSNSQYIYQEARQMALKEIFSMLDSDRDGLISARRINISGLETELLKILAPLLAEMEEVGAELDEQQFCESAANLFRTLTVADRNVILRVLKPRRAPQPDMSQPSLNEKSLMIASRVRTVTKPGVSLYEFCEEKKMLKEEKLKEERMLRQMKEYEECTFHPQTRSTSGMLGLRR